MTKAPNQTQIEPSEEAVSDATTEFFGEDGYGLRAEIKAALVIAYAIDLAPIIAERDRMKAALETIVKDYEHFMTDIYGNVLCDDEYAAALARAALEPKP